MPLHFKTAPFNSNCRKGISQIKDPLRSENSRDFAHRHCRGRNDPASGGRNGSYFDVAGFPDELYNHISFGLRVARGMCFLRRDSMKYRGFRLLAALIAALASSGGFMPLGAKAAMELPGPVTKNHSDVESDCSSCHKTDSATIEPASCLNCHSDLVKMIDSGKGVHASKNQYCGTCHKDHRGRDVSLKPDRAVIHSGDFHLTGKHLVVPCEQCHLNGLFKGTPKECQACHWIRHQDDLYRTKLGIECGKCHSPNSWVPANWKHTIETGFELAGNHKGRACDECHPNLQFTGTDPACYSCHSGNYNGVKDPDHKAAGFPLDCSLCHNNSSFENAHFDHASFGFALTGAHLQAQCAQCHPNRRYHGTSPECYSCHKSDYEGAKDPDHAAGHFPTDCSICHTPAGFEGGFNHSSTGFQLTGAHLQAECSQCHPNGRFEGTPQQCYACHQSNYDAATNPNHKAAGFSTDCQQCHTPSGFSQTTFNHDSVGLHLAGAHATLECSQCHVNGKYAGTSQVCYTCHKSNYEGVKDPDHKKLGFPTDCTFCHKFSDFSFSQAKFDHPYFPITTAPHSSAFCSDCHTSPSNFGTFDCTNCHGKNRTDSAHQSVPGYKYEARFCYACHPEGRI
jgi:hypothetical protein